MALLPAATTTVVPAATASSIAAWVAGELEQGAEAPRERLMTCAGVGLSGTPGTGRPAAQRMASLMSAMVPPHLPRTRTAWTRELQLTPATPRSLPVRTTPTVPATWVPCQLLGSPGLPGPHSPAHHPVPGVGGVVVAPVAVVGGPGAADHVVAGHQRRGADDVLVLGQDAGVDHRHDHRRAAGVPVPGPLEADPPGGASLLVAVVEVVPLAREEGVAGRGRDPERCSSAGRTRPRGWPAAPAPWRGCGPRRRRGPARAPCPRPCGRGCTPPESSRSAGPSCILSSWASGASIATPATTWRLTITSPGTNARGRGPFEHRLNDLRGDLIGGEPSLSLGRGRGSPGPSPRGRSTVAMQRSLGMGLLRSALGTCRPGSSIRHACRDPCGGAGPFGRDLSRRGPARMS